MIQPWMVIAGVTVAIASLSSAIRPQDIRWFNRQRRPEWLTFERWIPVIWSVIFVAGAISAHEVWQAEPGQASTWARMGGYALLELLVIAYSPVMFWLRSLWVGTFIGGIGWIWGLILTLWVGPVSTTAIAFLIPYLLWAPIGTITTWQMAKINRARF